jgi:hypothetical protein
MSDIAWIPASFKFSAARTIADVVRQGSVRLPAADAALILRECRFAGQQRDLGVGGKRHVAVLSEIMRRGQWRDHDKIDFAQVGENLYLVNGYHRLTAQIETGMAVNWILVIHQCADIDAVRRLYHSFDTNVRARSNETILTAVGLADELGVSKTTASKLYKAVPLISAGFRFHRGTFDHIGFRVIDERLELARRFGPAAAKWEAATAPAPQHVRIRLSTQGALAVALVCFRDQPVRAREFWGGVALNDGLSKGDPRNTYLQMLNATSSGGTAYALARQASIAWNAWFSDRTLKIIKVYEGDRVTIDGTEFEG